MTQSSDGFIKVCRVEDVPPGKGKIVRVGDRDVFVFNREGRVFASIDDAGGAGPAAGGQMPAVDRPAVCLHPGSVFDVEQEDSLARSQAHGRAVAVRVTEDGIYLAIDEAGNPAAPA